MNVDLIRLKNNLVEYIYIDEIYSFEKELVESSELEKLDSVKINGYVTKNHSDRLEIDLNVSGTMVIPCSVTLKPVEIPFNIKISGDLDEMLEEIDKNSKKAVNTIDILPIIWENILMEIPMKVISEDVTNLKTEGDGWKLITEEQDKINPELQKLKDLL